ncbi:MAG: diguanylate cyclase [Clostridiales bacterium]|nr:diguanylate cyclase [Clostridiales bacterium]
MRKVCLVIVILLAFSTMVFGDIEDTIDVYIERVINGDFNSDDLAEYKQINDKSIGAQALELFLQARINLNNYAYKEAYENLEESLLLLEKKQYSRLEAEVVYYLAEIDMFFGNITDGTQRSFQLRDISSEIDYKIGIIEADYNIAYSYIYNYDYDEGTKFAEEAFDLSNELDYNKGFVNYYSFLGNIDYFYGNHQSAIEKFTLALEQVEAVTYNYVVEEPHIAYKRVLGYENIKNGDPEIGLAYAEELLELIPSDNYYHLYMVHDMIGNYYYNSDLDEALLHYVKALEYYNQSSYPENSYPYEVYLLESIGNVEFDLEHYESAAKYYNDVINFEYKNVDDNFEKMLSGLDELKYAEINNKMSLLEQLNSANEEKLILSRNLILVMTIGIIILLTAVVFIVIEIRAKSKTEKKLYYTSVTDSLTQLYNRGKIIDVFSSNLETDNAVILLDLDDFKEINDTYGHIAGDEVLIKISQIIKKSIRENDQVGRYGGEEFLVFLKDTSREELREIAERIRANIESYEWQYEGLVTTASIGITTCFSTDAEEVLHEADTLMYKAKNAGKNRVVFGS